MHAKALGTAADEIVLDLEDSVAPDAKQEARAAVRRTLGDPSWADRTVAVRVNAPGSPELGDDLALCAELAGAARLTVVVPKVQSPGELLSVADRLAEFGAPELGLQALVETPAGIAAAAAIATATPRLQSLILGYADLATALGRRGAERRPETWLYQQEAVLAAARAAGIQAIDGPFLRLGDQLGLARAALAARELGFDGKWAIHPEQVEPLNRAFAVSEEELGWAEAVQSALERAAADGDAAIRVDGAMVDEAMRAHARRLLALPRRSAPEASAGSVVGPAFYEDLELGQEIHAPGVTLTDAHAALHQAIVGDRLRLALDHELSRMVTGAERPLAHPMLVCDMAIGQSTEPSGRVLGNLFYRGLAARPVHIGTTLRSRTTVVAKRRARAASGRPPRGMVVLRVTTEDEAGQKVLDYLRCPLLPARAEGEEPGDDIQAITADEALPVRELVPSHWDLEALRSTALGPCFAELDPQAAWVLEAGESVTCATELARLSLNLAMTHTDPSAGAHGQRLVYGGHVIGIAAAHLTRVLPDLATILAWRSCDHLGPTFEGDVLRSEIAVEELEPLADGGLVHARIKASARSGDGEPRPVLDWRLSALMP